MKKISRITVFVLMLITLALLVQLQVFAAATFELPKTRQQPVIDGILDEAIYTKMHNFYDIEGFKLDADADKAIKGAVYATYDDVNLYVFTVVEAENHDSVGTAIDMGEGTVGYLAILSTAPGKGWTDASRAEIGIGVKNDGTQEWKTCSPADIKDSSDGGGTDFYAGKCPYQYKVIRDEAAKKTYYEWAVPWSFLDRTGQIKFTEGHEITFNYAYNLHTEEEYFAGNRKTVELGGGVWTGTYEDGMIIKLGAAPPEPVAEAAPEAAAADDAPAAAVKPAANPKTGDGAVSVAVLLILSAVCFVSIRKARS